MTTDTPRRETALDSPEAKIWRYIDLPKFVSILSRRALFFANPLSFEDPFEGWLPRSYVEAMAGLNQAFINQQNELRAEVVRRNPEADLTAFHRGMDDNLARYANRAKDALLDVCGRFGVSCWHKSEYESEAMWRAYPERSVAIESTVGRLHEANRSGKNVLVENVRYMDFDKDPIDKGYRHFLLFLKRKPFEHERELRATVLLGEGNKGDFVDYDIGNLIVKIHISPRSDEAFRQTILDDLKLRAPELASRVVPSRLYEKPDYNIELKISR